MLFQHYTVDDLIKWQDLLNSPLTIENIQMTLDILNPNMYIHTEELQNGVWISIRTNEVGKVAIYGGTFSSVLLFDGGVKHSEFGSINAWVYHENIPVIVDVAILREDFPQLNHIECDVTAAREAWQLTYNK